MSSAFRASRSSPSRSGNGAESMGTVCHGSKWKTATIPAWIKGNHTCYSNRDLWCPGPLRPTPIDAFQKHRELCTRQVDGSFRGLRPDESSSLQTLGKQTQAVSVPPQKLHDVASASTKNEDMSGERLLFENGLHLRAQAIESTAHVGHARGQPYLRPAAKFDHLRKLSRIDLNSDGSAPLSTLIIARPGNSM